MQARWKAWDCFTRFIDSLWYEILSFDQIKLCPPILSITNILPYCIVLYEHILCSHGSLAKFELNMG